ncbi:MAG: FAD-dependent oxidoreductase [Coriobacteriales bacterium]|jgi:phytoene dehydrogenase-like protein|nr:FAD-dependent oxidoreductase [Coriobacteriales bacterium]
MAKQYDAIVIGAGIGGLSAALLMASKGKHVLILEKLNDVGGRLTSHKKDGFTIDMGVHVISCTTKGPLGEILRRAGEESSIEYKKIRPVSSFDGNVFIFPHDLPKFGVSEDDMEALMKCMGAIRSISDEEVSSYDDITIEDYLSRYTDDPMIHACFLNISTIYTCLPSWKLSAGEFMRCMRAESTAKASGYPEGGCIAISHELEDAFKAKGGEVICTSPVEKIIIEDGRAT